MIIRGYELPAPVSEYNQNQDTLFLFHYFHTSAAIRIKHVLQSCPLNVKLRTGTADSSMNHQRL